MRIGAVGSYWTDAAREAGLELVELQSPIDAMPKPQADPVASRMRDGGAHAAAFARTPVKLVVDSNFEGLSFVPAQPGRTGIDLLHERLGIPLASHLVDPFLTCMRGIAPGASLAAARSGTWWKFVFDRAQMRELIAFGIPNVEHLPQAAPDRIAKYAFTKEPLNLAKMERTVAFIGSQSSNYFGMHATHKGDNQLIGAMALARKFEHPDATFFDSYYKRYGAGDLPSGTDSPEMLANKFLQYSNHKLFYIAAMWVAQRNRYVRFLAAKLGADLHVFGTNWESIGVGAMPPFEGEDGYLRAFRTSLINVNLNNGNTETGVNQRAFEITAAGGFMLCAHTSELPELFHVGEECDSFRNEDELIEKIAFYRTNPERAAAVALAGQARTLKDHLFSNRLKTILERVGLGMSTGMAAGAGRAAA